MNEEIVFPEYEFTYEVIAIHFEIAQFDVTYKPVDQRLTAISLSLPIFPDMDVNNLTPYIQKYAPRQKWYAQEVILNHSQLILGATG